MSKQNNLKDYLTDLYEGISTKRPSASRNPQNFRAEIESIQVGKEAKLQEKTLTANGVYPPDSGYDGFSKVTVDVAGKVLPKYDGEVIIEGEPESGGEGGGSGGYSVAHFALKSKFTKREV